MFHYTIEVSKTIEESILLLEEILNEKGFGILAKTNFKDKLKEKGVVLNREFIALEICNPNLAKVALELNPFVGYFMPCKIIFYYSDNFTRVGMVKPSYLAGLLGDPKLEELVNDIESILMDALNQLKKVAV